MIEKQTKNAKNDDLATSTTTSFPKKTGLEKSNFISLSNSCCDTTARTLEWKNLYKTETRFKKFTHKDSIKHPAKMSFGLLDKIFEHLEETDLTSDTVIVDFMAGTGRTGLVAALSGYKSIMVELEDEYIKMQKKNIKVLEQRIGKTDIRVMKGDARNLAMLLRNQVITPKVGIISPPYEDAEIPQIDDNLREALHTDKGKRTIDEMKKKRAELRESGEWEGYNRSDNRNIGNLKEKEYEDAMTEIYSEAKSIGISPLVVVTKNPTRKGKLVDVASITAHALERAGYTIYDYHRARLFDTKTTKTSKLFPRSQKKTQGRVSFFKRLSMEKGNVAAEWEDIIFAR